MREWEKAGPQRAEDIETIGRRIARFIGAWADGASD